MSSASLLEILSSQLISAAEDMRSTLIRTSFNPVVYEAFDFGISVYNWERELIAEAEGLTSFLGANDFAVRKIVEHMGEDRLAPGDVVLLNYPYWSSSHTMDVAVVAPVFIEPESRPQFYLAVRTHWSDIGAKDAGYVVDSTDLHQEGLVFPCLKVCKRGELDREIVDLIRFNSRNAELVIGDLEAQIMALRAGERRIKQIAEKTGLATLRGQITTLLDHGEEVTRAALRSLPHGTWTAECRVETTAEAMLLKVAVTIDADHFAVDFTGTAPQVAAPINATAGLTESMCKVVLKSLTAPLSSCTGGSFRALRVTSPPGTVLHATYPAPTFTQAAGVLVPELIARALAPAVPERLAASSGGGLPGFMMVDLGQATMVAISNNEPVGFGATAWRDGNNAVNHVVANSVRNTPVELLEMTVGLRVERLELSVDSGGAGKFRGGLGVERDIVFTSHGNFITVIQRTEEKPWALTGGGEPERSHAIVGVGSPARREVGMHSQPVAIGDRVRMVTAGGGGFGDPKEREREAVLRDVRNGYVSCEAAFRIYGVVACDHQHEPDRTAT